MGNMRRIADELSPKASDPLEVAGEGTDPAPENANNSGIAATAGGASPSWRYRGKRARATTAAIAAVAVIVVCGFRYIMSGRFPSYLKISQLRVDDASRLPLDDASMQKYINDFNEAAAEMEEALSSGAATRQGFQRHFTPSLEDGQSLPRDPLEIIRDHVAKMRECDVPSASSPQARRDFAQHLQLLRSICRTAALRLHDLELFNTTYKVLGAPNPLPIPGLDEDYSDTDAPIDFEEVSEYDWTASTFLKCFGLFGADARRVNRTLAKKLRLSLDMEKTLNDANLRARYYFMEFLQPFEGDGAINPAHAPAEHQIPYTGKLFRTGAFAQAAAQICRESDANTSYAFIRKLNRIADNWTNEEVAAAAKQQAKGNADNAQDRLKTKRELMRRLLSQGIPEDDLVMIALFLL
ncbi:uncharacterized protein EMH_0035770 [Eimeria mitis]|uniref:Uncharacterized protein n=1 Tax=Eimeria mitis TaxID=44415 RepID=U6JR01_9EIME|nr:uncharacterized protein EMH_0035770 [Eimeria mitis]CDJ27885.1 hypothetical protein EMH_0035770 [Eimeria mitis]